MIPKVDSIEDLAAVFDVFRTAYGDRRILNTVCYFALELICDF